MKFPDAVVLVDNGSLRPEVVLGLRRLASDLEGTLGIPVWAASNAHSNGIDPDALGGCPGLLLSDCLEMLTVKGARWIGVQPLLLASGSAIYRGIRKTVDSFLDRVDGKCRVDVAPALCDASEVRELTIAKIIASRVEEVLRSASGESRVEVDVVVVDHGSPFREVTAVRNELAVDVGQLLQRGVVSRVIPASMERRPGDEYAFNDPLLEPLLLSLESRPGHRVVVAMAFLQEGRHAGPGGDVAMICERVKVRRPDLRLMRTGLIADHPLMVPLLENRIRTRWTPGMDR